MVGWLKLWTLEPGCLGSDLSLPFTGCVSLGQLHSLSVLQSPCVDNGDNNGAYLVGLHEDYMA